MNRLSIRHIDIAGGVIVAVLTILGWITIIQPMRQNRAEIMAAYSQLAREETAVRQLELQRGGLQERVDEIGRLMKAESVNLLAPGELNSRLAEITRIVEDAGMVIQESELGDPMTRTWYQAVPITIAGTGQYPQCAAFLEQLHATMRDTGVLGMRVRGNPREPGSAAEFEFELVWFAAVAVASAEGSTP